MIVEITTYKAAARLSHKALVAASHAFDRDYCARCKGLVRRHFLKTEEGYMDIFLWESQADAEHVKATFLQDEDARAYVKCLDPASLTMHNYELLGTFEPGAIASPT